MKTTPLIILIVSLLLAGTGVKCSMDQQKVMNLLVATHGNGELSKEGGLYQVSTSLQKQVDEAAINRKALVDAAEQARLKKNDAEDKRATAASNLTAKQDELKDWNKKLEESEARTTKLKAEYEASMAKVSTDLKDQLPQFSDSDVDLGLYAQAIKDYVESTKEEIASIEKSIEENVTTREQLVVKIAELKINLDRIHDVQAQFTKDYKQNSTEYTVAGVDTRWHFVVFFAEPSDGLLPGDSIPLLGHSGDAVVGALQIESVKGNVVIARYDTKTLPLGRPIQAGDRLFRKKPLGH